MDGREIPGFYYDRDNGKYYKILEPHNAPGPAAKYTSQNIKLEQQKLSAQKDAAIRTTKRQQETVVRRYLKNSLFQATLDREIGSRRASYYTKNIWPDACASRLAGEPHDIVTIPPRSRLRHFDRDPVTRTLYAVHGDNKIKSLRSKPPTYFDPAADDDNDWGGTVIPKACSTKLLSTPITIRPRLYNEYGRTWHDLATLTSPISSLSILPTSSALAATTYGSDRPPVVYFCDPDTDGPFVGQQFTPKNTSGIWASAAKPTFSTEPRNSIALTDTENLAVAASKSLLLFARSPTGGAWDFTTVLKTDSDILSVDWMSPTLIALGERSGKIRLYDTRSKGSSHILTHPGPVLRIRRADDPTRVVCAGMQDTLFLYDIRSRCLSSASPYAFNGQHRNHHPRSDNHKKRKRENRATPKYSQPVLSFQYCNTGDQHLGIDIHPRLGLVAAAQDSTSVSMLRLHNLWTGKVVKEYSRFKKLSGSDYLHDTSTISRLKFMEDDGTGPGEVRR
ncbi:hypothetical protein K458DRAFT_385098 [Lentithecium fluviatile CBS 122367]|uniref:WD40 repeat-like protein n=1 Tax=Lentithecium fluviatile CBS 122367 TaxID=1168545 RepID=A0A6G1JEE2_9PLEO|nr:hypothetical protein K458DRAFT_385098 [Lentithecium fluviatile CBS 122367]